MPHARRLEPFRIIRYGLNLATEVDHIVDFGTIERKELKRVQKLVNERPRKVLNWHTLAEAFADPLLS